MSAKLLQQVDGYNDTTLLELHYSKILSEFGLSASTAFSSTTFRNKYFTNYPGYVIVGTSSKVGGSLYLTSTKAQSIFGIARI